MTDLEAANPLPSHDARFVQITINAVAHRIHRGHQLVAAIKILGSVAAAEELEQIIDGVFSPLPDDGALTIKGGEIFISHVRASAGA